MKQFKIEAGKFVPATVTEGTQGSKVSVENFIQAFNEGLNYNLGHVYVGNASKAGFRMQVEAKLSSAANLPTQAEFVDSIKNAIEGGKFDSKNLAVKTLKQFGYNDITPENFMQLALTVMAQLPLTLFEIGKFSEGARIALEFSNFGYNVETVTLHGTLRKSGITQVLKTPKDGGRRIENYLNTDATFDLTNVHIIVNGVEVPVAESIILSKHPITVNQLMATFSAIEVAEKVAAKLTAKKVETTK